MNLDELNAMKYADLYQLGKEKLKIKRRMPKDKLIDALMKMHDNLLSDTNFVSDDSQLSEEAEPVKEEPVPAPKRGRKRGKKSKEDQPELKKSKQDLSAASDKEEEESPLNSTFTKEDEPEIEATKKIENPEPEVIKPETPKTPARRVLKRTTSCVADTTKRTPNNLKKTLSTVEAPTTPVTKKDPEAGLRSAARMSMSQPRPARPVAMVPSTPASARKAVQFTSSSAKKPGIKPRAAPNFAEIHQKNFEKMQSVDEYVEKKKARTEALKATTATTPAAPQPMVVPKSQVKSTATTPAPARFNFVSGLQKPVFTAKGLVEKEKQRVVATVKENVLNASTTNLAGKLLKRKSIDSSTANKKILKGVRVNRRFELQMQHRKLKQ